MTSRLLAAVILLTTASLAVLTVRWADAEFFRVEPPGELNHSVSRPEWVRAVHHPYRRLQHDGLFLCAMATLGLGAILAVDPRTWKRPTSPVRIAGGVPALAAAITATHILLASPAITRTNGVCYGLRNALEYQVPGAVLGAWLVAALVPGRRDSNWRDWMCYVVGGFWLAKIGLLIAYAPLFG